MILPQNHILNLHCKIYSLIHGLKALGSHMGGGWISHLGS